jgi:hypothetical protein
MPQKRKVKISLVIRAHGVETLKDDGIDGKNRVIVTANHYAVLRWFMLCAFLIEIQ